MSHISRFTKIKYTLSTMKGVPISTDLSIYQNDLEAIQKLSYSRFSNTELTEIASKSTERIEVFALTVEACRRKLGLEPFKEQIIAGLALSDGKLIEMGTGEGKTLAAVFAAVFSAYQYKRFHILTANEYLACRDAEWMGPIYTLLGLTAGTVQENMTDDQKRKAYDCNITYLTVRQAGFDFLNDQIVYHSDDKVQRPLLAALVDEADFIMIDEGRIPLVLAGTDNEFPFDPVQADAIISSLKPDVDFQMDRVGRSCFLLAEGRVHASELLGVSIQDDEEMYHLTAAVNVALHAHYLLQKDVDYIIKENRIELVDQNTGRIAEKRKWPYGIQTALEIKEDVPIQDRGVVKGRISIHHFLQLYPKLAGMTATAVPAAAEFKQNFNLDILIIPPVKPSQMQIIPDRIFYTKKEKYRILLQEIQTAHFIGRPVLVGTGSVKESELISKMLAEKNIIHSVLNAKQDQKEAAIIAQAGQLGAVTISTNMAGRGTDIILGDGDGDLWQKVRKLGGLLVFSTTKHESRRIDDQLRGRAGRQGDPGQAVIFVSLEDDLIQKYAISEFIPRQYFERTGEEEIHSKKVVREIDRAQEIIQDQHHSIRRDQFRYGEIIEVKRKMLSEIRNDALFNMVFPETVLRVRNENIENSPQKVKWKEDSGKVLRKIFLTSLDGFWKDYLMEMELLLDGIFWRKISHCDPLLEYIKDCSDSFDLGFEDLCQKVVKKYSSLTFEEFEQLSKEINMQRIPSSTWTYTLRVDELPGFQLGLLNLPIAVQAVSAMASIPLLPLYLIRTLSKKLKGFFKKKE